MTTEIPRLVLDANIMVSAVLGKSFPFMLRLFEAGIMLYAPVHQLAETRSVLRRRPALPAEWIDAQMTRLLALVQPLHPAILAKHETVARARLGERGQPDWPVVAGTYEVGGAAWSHDRDLFGTGTAVWSTAVLRREIERQTATEG